VVYTKPKFPPGLFSTDTPLEKEGSYVAGNRVRFYQNKAQPVGGCVLDSPDEIDGYPRGGHSWTNLQGQPCKAYGTELKLYGEVSGSRKDITPLLHFTVLTDAFSTVNGSPIVTVNLPYHNAVVGTPFVFSNHQATVGGLTIEGTYTVTEVAGEGAFTITHGSNASSTVTDGGGNVDLSVELPDGLVSNDLTGWGAGTWSTGTWGGATASNELRVWTMGNLGENLQANPSGYGLAEWQPETTYDDLSFNGEFTTNADGWALGTGWAYSAGGVVKTPGVASNLSQSTAELGLDGRTCVVDFVITGRTAGSIKFQANAGDPAAPIDVSTASAVITKNGTYRRIFRVPADLSDFLLAADAAFDGKVESFTYRLYDKAYFIPTAPARIDAISVSAKNVVIALGCTTVDGLYSPTAVRNCDVGNNRLWIPDANNVAGQIEATEIGGRIMAGSSTRQQDAVWGDAGFGVLTWLGEPGGAFKFDKLAKGCGLLSRHSYAECSGFLIWASRTKKMWIFRGIGATSLGAVEEIECPIRDDIFDNLDANQSLKCFAWANDEWTEFWFHWPDSRDVTAPTPAECSRYAAFNWLTKDVWSMGMWERTAAISGDILPSPVLFEPRDGAKSLAYQHEVGTDDNGALLGAYLETSWLDQVDGEAFTALLGMRPDFKDQTGDVEMTVYSKIYPQATTVKTTGPFVLTPTTEQKNFRVNARMVRFRFDWVTTGGHARFGAWSVDIGSDGSRR